MNHYKLQLIRKFDNLTAIMDHNKFQTDMLVRDVNNIEDVVNKVSAFGWHVVRINGHDYNELKKTFTELKKVTDKPKMIVADTIKGRGVSFMEKPEVETFAGKDTYTNGIPVHPMMKVTKKD